MNKMLLSLCLALFSSAAFAIDYKALLIDATLQYGEYGHGGKPYYIDKEGYSYDGSPVCCKKIVANITSETKRIENVEFIPGRGMLIVDNEGDFFIFIQPTIEELISVYSVGDESRLIFKDESTKNGKLVKTYFVCKSNMSDSECETGHNGDKPIILNIISGDAFNLKRPVVLKP